MEDFKGIRAGNLERKANRILDNAKSEGRLLTEQEQDRLHRLSTLPSNLR